MRAISVELWSTEVSKRNCWSRDRESCMYEFKCMRDINVRLCTASTSWGFPGVGLLSFCLYSRTPVTPEYPKDPIKYSRRPASVILIVIKLKLVFVLMHRASGPRRSSFCKPWPWRPVHQDNSQPKIPDQRRGQLITHTPREEGRGCSSLPLIVSLRIPLGQVIQ
jgi:hypothetical protein